MNYGNIMHFKGTWRSYQARVLASSQRYIADGKIHIVAAPGSGKTTLGIELICRMGEPALVLTPSVTIRQQWAARIEDGFLNEGFICSDYVSQNLRDPKVITAATYQALHRAMTRSRGEEAVRAEAGGGEEAVRAEAGGEEAADYSDFDLVQTVRECGIKTLCLDECHHLRAEWWKALEELKRMLGDVKIIALTATPPYDSAPALWKRYIDMCGEIDEEITVPELVKEGSLCPHQDYVYFNYPTEEEAAEVARFSEKSRQTYERLLWDGNLREALASHASLSGDEEAWDALLKDREYFLAFLTYLRGANVPFPDGMRRMAGSRALQSMTPAYMERLLQGFLYEDPAYRADAYKKELEKELKSLGLIEKRRVSLTASASLEKLLMTSKGKSRSILAVVQAEYAVLKDKLRLLILTDYIRDEYERAIGAADADVTALGVIPFFEQIRRSCPGDLRLGVLCGSVVVIPAGAREALLAASGGRPVRFAPIGGGKENGYLKAAAAGDSHFLTVAVTELFTQGWMQVLIGTKSLLGEGWDAPCVNTLILASFVGSFMLSNQMRGRAIRVLKEEPEKSSNIWHLVCLPPDGSSGGDYTLLQRRMEHFLGLHYEKDQIESGIGRLSVIAEPFDRRRVEEINARMLQLAAERGRLRERWMRALTRSRRMEVVERTEIAEEAVPRAAFEKNVRPFVLSLAAAVVCGILGTVIGMPAGGVFAVLGFAGAGTALVEGVRMAGCRSSAKRLKLAAEGVREALGRLHLLEESRCRVAAEEADGRISVGLDDAGSRDQALFSSCMRELFGPVDSQRYLLKGTKPKLSYYGVPELFGKRREDAQMFAACMQPYLGPHELVYTRSASGREFLLDARVQTAGRGGMAGGTKKRISAKE